MGDIKIVAVYPQPTNVEEFEKAYTDDHVPMVGKVKGLKKFVATRVIGTPDGSTPPFYRIAELYFSSMDDLTDALTDPAGQETAAHAISISSGGTPLFMIAEEDESLF
jgi:uncharacterized protein (TIGR02118 family)